MNFPPICRNFSLLLGCIFLLTAPNLWAQAPTTNGKTGLLWVGQAGFRIKSPTGKVIDPKIVPMTEGQTVEY